MADDKPRSGEMPQARPQRLVSIDALRGFDMLWIIGAETLFFALKDLVEKNRDTAPGFIVAVIGFFTRQMEHSEWAGFRFYDLIFPLFIFLAGVSIVFSLTRIIETKGRVHAVKHILRRGIILFALGIVYWGGVAHRWPDIRIMGVLQRIALCYVFAGLAFCFLDFRKMVTLCAALLIGYWGVMALAPMRDIHLEPSALSKLSKETGISDPTMLFKNTTKRVSGRFERGYNVADHVDFRFLPGEKYDTYADPEGLLSTLPAIATCLLGVFAGLLLRSAQVLDEKKVIFLIAAGMIAINIGWVWGLEFPIIKKIWSSSFVLVSGGCSAIFLGLFYLLVDVWKYQKWCRPLVWVGMNSITIYMASELIGYRKIAQRLTGGDIAWGFDHYVMPGFGELVIVTVSLLLALLLARFLYRKKIFLKA